MRGLALTLLTALLVVASATPALAQYRIGMSAAITGPASSTYAPTYEAYKAYFKRINDAGGINGQKVEIAYEDDRGEPQRAAANAKKLAEGSILMVNASTSATYKPFMTESETEKLPLLFGGGVCPREAFPPASPLIFCSTSFGSKWDSLFALRFNMAPSAATRSSWRTCRSTRRSAISSRARRRIRRTTWPKAGCRRWCSRPG